MGQRIVAIGGGATGEPLRDYILALSGNRCPKLLWVNTGMAEDARGALRVYDFFEGRAGRVLKSRPCELIEPGIDDVVRAHRSSCG